MQIDIQWCDLAAGVGYALFARGSAIEGSIRALFEQGSEGLDGGARRTEAVAGLSVRSCFDALLTASAWPAGSEVIMSAVNIGDMGRIVAAHGLVPVPIDVDLERLTPALEALEAAVTPRTRAIVIAHLFGGVADLRGAREVARKHGLLLIEDAAQAFGAVDATSPLVGDVRFFSFGPIKTATALGGAVMQIADTPLRVRVEQIQAAWPKQSRTSFLVRLLRFSVIKVLADTKILLPLLIRALRVAGIEYDAFIMRATRSFIGPDLLGHVRRRPSAAQLALLLRRLQRPDAVRLALRARRGRLAQTLCRSVPRPGSDARDHVHWLLPVLVDDPTGLCAELQRQGFDATQGATSLCVIEPPAGRDAPLPTARHMMEHIVFLPAHNGVSGRDLRRQARSVRRWVERGEVEP